MNLPVKDANKRIGSVDVVDSVGETAVMRNAA